MDTTHTQNKLNSYGWEDHFSRAFVPFAAGGSVPARILRAGRDIFRGMSGEKELTLTLSGSFRYRMDLGLQPMPSVGDWCAVHGVSGSRALIEGVLPRKTVLERFSADASRESGGNSETLAANIDTAAVVMDVARDFNIRRIERFLANIEAGGAEGALILTKIDLVDDPGTYRRRAASRFGSLGIYLLDSLSGRGREELAPLLRPGHCTALLGLSGAGKSTLLNMLMGVPVAGTAAVREKDGRGRHTTTARELYRTPNGALLIDTPGIRSVGIAAGKDSILDSFGDIAELVKKCRFSDCTHRNEPGCAVREALAAELIEQDRYLNYLRLLQEAGSREEDLRRRKAKDTYLGKLRYNARRDIERRSRDEY